MKSKRSKNNVIKSTSTRGGFTHFSGLFISICLSLFLFSCGSIKRVPQEDIYIVGIGNSGNRHNDEIIAESAKSGKDNLNADNTIMPEITLLIEEANQWKGTPYKYGGKTREGADCSGFVMAVYENALGISLPRNSKEQCEFCIPVKKHALSVGDLIFFTSAANKGKIAHVGIYIGDRKMIHASSSKGVIESTIEDDYYQRYFVCCGRVPNLSK